MKVRVKENSWHKKFLDGLRMCANLRMACEYANIDRSTAFKARYRDPEFAAKWDQVKEDAVDELEREAWRRAFKGVKRVEPIMYQGQKVAQKIVVEHSDRLMELLLKANRPDKYREQIKFITETEADKAIEAAIHAHSLPAGTIDATEQNT